MREAEKTWNIWTEDERKIISEGCGIDIGCGDSPIYRTARCFDIQDGDANEIGLYVHEQFDYVFSAHCLEHMRDPTKTIKEWWQLVRPGGVMIVIVPDEDLYEQGNFPSLFNSDHKWTFTISKRKSWSPCSLNVLDLARSLNSVSSFNIELQDFHYDRSLLCFRQLSFPGHCLRFLKYRILDHLPIPQKWFYPLYSHFFAVDQTLGNAMAQIQLKVFKSENRNGKC